MTTMTEVMTDTAFKSYADKAAELGREHGLRDRAAHVADWGHGPEEALQTDYVHDLPSPLSGEWAGDLTANELMHTLGLAEVDPDDKFELCDVFDEAHTMAFFGDN